MDLTARVFDACPKLEVVSKLGIGMENIDHDAAARHDVAVYNNPGAFSGEVADVVLGYTIMLTVSYTKWIKLFGTETGTVHGCFTLRREFWYCRKVVFS